RSSVHVVSCLCDGCLTRSHAVGAVGGFAGLEQVIVLFHYGGPVQRAIVAAKHGARQDVFRAFGRLLADAHRSDAAGPRPDLVTWVPASRQGRSARGFDQGRLMARTLGRELGVPVQRVLRRGGGTQHGRDRNQRLSGVTLRARGPVPGRVLLVDDVITTGTSMVTAAGVMRTAGATTVAGIAVAWAASTVELSAGRPLPASGSEWAATRADRPPARARVAG
ncbi:MAG: phosphoribosyltransferase family protein, partial [Actinomycetota bacterium]